MNAKDSSGYIYLMELVHFSYSAEEGSIYYKGNILSQTKLNS